MRGRDISLAACVAVALAMAAACEDPYAIDSRDSYSGPPVPDIAGEWSGYHYVRRGGRNVGQAPVTATIFQNEADRTRVTVVTSLRGTGQFFSGTIDSDGYMWMIDAYDGEIWTTHYRKATSDLVEMDDYLMDDHVITAVNVIYLDRHLRSDNGRGSNRLSIY